MNLEIRSKFFSISPLIHMIFIALLFLPIPIQASLILTPDIGSPGETVTIVVIGQGTHFIQGKTKVSFIPNVIKGTFYVENPNVGKITTTIDKSVPPGTYRILVTTEEYPHLDKEAAFTVTEKGKQVSVRVDVFAKGPVSLEGFFNNSENGPLLFHVTLNNDHNNRTVNMVLKVNGEKFGVVTTGSRTLKNIKPFSVHRLSNHNFHFNTKITNKTIIEHVQKTGFLPSDIYTYSITVIDEQGKVLASHECTQIITNPTNSIRLIGPGTPASQVSDTIETTTPLFQWFSNASIFDLDIYPVHSWQKSLRKAIHNKPIASIHDIREKAFLYPPSAKLLETGKTYVWQIKAYSRKSSKEKPVLSDLFSFTIGSTMKNKTEKVTSITVSPADVTISQNQSIQFKAQALDKNTKVIESQFTWRVIPSKAGKINQNGLFTPKGSPMSAAVVASAGKVKNYSIVTIRPSKKPQSISLLSPRNNQVISGPKIECLWRVQNMDKSSIKRACAFLYQWNKKNKTYSTTAIDTVYSENNDMLFITWHKTKLQDRNRYKIIIELFDSTETGIGISNSSQFSIKRNTKIEWELYQVWAEMRTEELDTQEMTLILECATDTLSQKKIDSITGCGATVLIHEANWVQIITPLSQLPALMELPFLKMIFLPSPHILQMQDGAHIRKESAKSPGNSSKTDEYFDIAVLDFGFDSTKSIYKKFIKFPIMRSFRYDQNILGSSSAESTHGSICATTITNTFPNSQLYLINFDTELEFLRALRYCVDTLQIRVISCSVSWMQAYDHYDGTSKLWHTIDKIIKDKSFLVISSGNFAQAHWEGHYTDANGDMSHDFNTNRSPLMVALKEGISYNFLLSWNEWNNPQTDLNLRIVDSHGNQLMSPAGIAYSSENRQTCGEYVRPVERISNLKVYAPGITKIYVDIFSNSQTITNDTKIHFELYQYPPPQESVPKAHRKSCLASGLATSRSESVVIVGASNVSYSSQGATNDGRTRPDFIASGVADYMGKNYSGTSFATCRVAAAFAKVLYRNPTWSLSNAMDLLKKNVLGKKNRSKDTVQGWGEIDFEKLNLSIHW